MPRDPVSVPDQTPQVWYAASGLERISFPFNFPYWEDEDLVVSTRPTAASTWNERFDYAVAPTSGVASTGYPSGAVVFNAPITDLEVLIRRERGVERISQFPAGAALDLPSLNRDLNKGVGLLQSLFMKIKTAIRSEEPEDVLDPSLLKLPGVVARAQQIVGFDGDGKLRLYESGSLGGGGGGGQTLYWQFAGDGSAVIFALPGATSGQASNYLVTLNGVRQTPEVDYEIDAEQLIFNEPPSADTARVVVQTMGAGLPGPTGAAGPAGLAGAAGPAGSVGPAGSAGVAGPAGPEGAPGPQGERGNDGTSVVILGTVANVGELPGSGNEIGDGYIIGGDLHVWTAGLEWVNVGAIVGPQGPQGPAGPAGAAGAQGPAGPAGAQGPEGPQGVQGDPGIVVSETAPAFPTVGLLWLDTSQGEPAT